MCSDGGGAATAAATRTTEEILLRGQKSANQLRALMASLLPPPPPDGSGAAAEAEAFLADVSDSLSQALASLQLGSALYSSQRHTSAPPGQGVLTGAGGGLRSTSRRSVQRCRGGVECRSITQHVDRDPYTWRKYGQKYILGAKFARSYFRCAHRSSDHGCCSAKKQVQRSDSDPSKLEITYIGAHTCHCHRPPPSRSAPQPVSSGERRSGDDHHLPLAPTSPTESLAPGDRGGATGVTTEMACSTPWTEQELASLFLVPSPACSLSELMSPEVPQLMAGDLPLLMELKVGDDGHVVVSDFVVPEL